jgi:uncharacterized membrane protein
MAHSNLILRSLRTRPNFKPMKPSLKSKMSQASARIENSRNTFSKLRLSALTLCLFYAPLILGEKPGGIINLLGLFGLLMLAGSYLRSGETKLNLNVLFSKKIFFILASVVTILWLSLLPIKYFSLSYTIFDTGIFAGEIQSLREGRGYWSSVLEMHGLRDHFAPALYLLAPLFEFASGVIILHALKFLAFIATAFLLLKLSRVVLGKEYPYLYALACLWLVHSYVARALDFEFQPSSLAIPFIVASFLLAEQGRYRTLLLTLLLLAGFKEHLSLVWISVGIFLWLKREPGRTLPYALILLGLAIGPVIYSQVMPLFSASFTPAHAARFGPFHLMGVKLLLLFKAFASVGFLPLLAPSTLLWVLPSFGIALLSKEPQMLAFGYHYQDVPLTVLFVASVFGLKNCTGTLNRLENHSPIYYRAAILTAVGSLILSNCWFVTRSIKRHWPSPHSVAVVESLNSIANQIPEHCSLWTLNSLGAYLYQHPRLRMIHGAREKFGRGDNIILLADEVDTWPMSQAEFTSLRQRLADSSFKRQFLQSLTLHTSKSCRIPRVRSLIQ